MSENEIKKTHTEEFVESETQKMTEDTEMPQITPEQMEMLRRNPPKMLFLVKDHNGKLNIWTAVTTGYTLVAAYFMPRQVNPKECAYYYNKTSTVEKFMEVFKEYRLQSKEEMDDRSPKEIVAEVVDSKPLEDTSKESENK